MYHLLFNIIDIQLEKAMTAWKKLRDWNFICIQSMRKLWHVNKFHWCLLNYLLLFDPYINNLDHLNRGLYFAIK